MAGEPREQGRMGTISPKTRPYSAIQQVTTGVQVPFLLSGTYRCAKVRKLYHRVCKPFPLAAGNRMNKRGTSA